MVRKETRLPAEEGRRLKELARAQGRSEAAIIRDAIRRWLEEEDARDAAWARLERMLGALPSTGSPSDRFDRAEAYANRVTKIEGPLERHPSARSALASTPTATDDGTATPSEEPNGRRRSRR